MRQCHVQLFGALVPLVAAFVLGHGLPVPTTTNAADFFTTVSRNPFVPAPPGSRPPCAAPGLTFCENVDGYPIDTVEKLVKPSPRPASVDNLPFPFFDESLGDQEPNLDALYPRAKPKRSPQLLVKLRKARSIVPPAYFGIQSAASEPEAVFQDHSKFVSHFETAGPEDALQ